MNSTNSFVTYLMQAGSSSLFQILFLLFPMLFSAFVINLFSRLVEKESLKLIGPTGYLYLFGWLGTFFHESGHALFCIIFRHKITDIKFFTPFSNDGTLGYVKHSYDSKSIYQRCGNFFIGIGPILTGALAIYVIVFLCFKSPFIIPDTVLGALDEWVKSSFSQGAFDGLSYALKRASYIDTSVVQWDNWAIWFSCYVIYCIGSSMSLSKEDLAGAFSGFLMILLVIVCLNLSLAWLAPSSASSILYPLAGEFFSILILTILFNGIVFIFLKTLNLLLGPLFAD